MSETPANTSNPTTTTTTTIPPPQQEGVNMKIPTPNVVFRTSSNASHSSGNSNGGGGGVGNTSGDLLEGSNTNGPIDAVGPMPNIGGGNSASMKKTSFQITSVTVDSSASNDGADDSEGEMDESHTEDSSEVATGWSLKFSIYYFYHNNKAMNE